MVTRRVTIKRFALACKGSALDCFPKGNHACAKHKILCFAQACLLLFLLRKNKAQDHHPKGDYGFPFVSYAFKSFGFNKQGSIKSEI